MSIALFFIHFWCWYQLDNCSIFFFFWVHLCNVVISKFIWCTWFFQVFLLVLLSADCREYLIRNQYFLSGYSLSWSLCASAKWPDLSLLKPGYWIWCEFWIVTPEIEGFKLVNGISRVALGSSTHLGVSLTQYSILEYQ